jgi:hypothetical protein
MSNAKGSGKDNKLTQPAKVVAQPRTEANAVSSQDLRQKAQRAVAMPAAAVRAAMASAAKGAVPAVRVAYDVLSRLLSFVETGHAVDRALLKTIKGALDTAMAGDALTKKTISKALNDITLMNEVVTRVISYNRTYTEVVRSTDQPAKSLTKAPRVDTARASDSRTVVLGKNYSDTLTFADSFTKIVTFRRNPVEALTSLDIKTFAVSKPRTDIARSTDAKATNLGKPKADTINLAELKRLNLGKVINDISRASDSDRITFTKRINDFVSAVHQANVDYAFTSSEVNLTQISDTLTRLISFVRLFTDVARPTDTLRRVVSKPRTERIVSADRVTRVVSFNKVFTDTERTADLLRRVVSYNRTRVETARAADAPAKRITKAPFVDTGRAIDASRRTFSKRRTEIARAADTFARVSQFRRNFNSTVASAQSIDIFSSVRQYRRSFFDTARSTDVFAKVTTYRRLPTEVLRATETFAKVFFRPRNFADVSRATDAFIKVVSYNRTRVDTARATETFTKVFFRPRNFVETSRATDLITAKFIAKRLRDLAGASDIFVITGNTRPGTFPPADQMKLRDIFKKLVSFIRTFNDTVTLAETKSKYVTTTVGTRYSVWTDFNELIVDNDTTQTLRSYRTDLMNVVETIGKRYTKVANKQLTYFYNAYPITDYNELSLARGSSVSSTDPDFTTTTQFDQDQFFTYTDSYTADSERALISDVVTRVIQSVRTFTDTARANEVVGRTLQRTVGDVRSRIFDDIADLFYVSESYSTLGGVGATVLVTNNYPVFGITITNAGVGYTVGQVFTLTTSSGNTVRFNVATINGTGGILTVNNIVGTAPRTTIQQSYFTDYYADLTFGKGTLDQDLAQYNALTFTFPGPDALDVGPRASEAKRSVWNQEMQYTLKDRADGDTVKYADSSSKQINKQARRYLPQGIFDDYAGLTFGTAFDMDLTQTLSKSWPESISVIDISSRVTLGPTKRNRDTIGAADAESATLRKPKTEISTVYDVFVKRYEKSAGAWANRTWRDYNEISGFALSPLLEMPIEYEGRFELILTPETIGKSITKPLRFQSYVWRDFNELTFGTTRDEEITFSWFNDSASDIARTMDFARRTISPRKSEILQAQETFGKDITIGGIGDYRNPGQFRDFLGLFPIGEHGVDGMPIMDEELIFKINPGSRTDRLSPVDSRVKRIDKYVVRRVHPYWSDPAELTFGTTYDQELVQYQPTTRDESFTASDLFRKVSTIIRGVNDIVRASDRMLLSKNGLTNSTYVFAPIPDAVRSQDTSGRQIVKAVGNYKSQSSLWEDFVELTVSYDLAQYYYRGPDSTLDISRTMDVKANRFTKQAGRVQNILNVATFDSDIFFNTDLLQTFAQDYVTEIIRPIDERTLRYGKNQSEIITLPEFFGKSIIKPGIGDTIVDDWAVYSPLYLNYFSDLEDSLQKQYPPRRIDVARSADTKANYYSKQAGFDPINKWYTNFEYLSNDETNVREGIIENRENTFPQIKFDKYLDEIIYEYNEEQILTPFRVERITAVDYFTRVLNTVRVYTDVTRANDQSSLTVSPATKAEIQNATDARTKQYNKTGGANLYTIWTDYNEIDVYQQDLTQYYEPYRVEYLKAIDSRVNRFTKPRADIARTQDGITRSVGLGKNENTRSVDALGKFVRKPQVGDSTLTAWYDSFEILSYDPTLLTYGEIRTTRFDIGRANDAVGKRYTVNPGEFKSRTWYDFNEFEITNAEAQYWPPYVVEPAYVGDSVTTRAGKRLVETPRSSDSGTVRVFSSNSYIRDISPYYASDYVNEGVVTSTF